MTLSAEQMRFLHDNHFQETSGRPTGPLSWFGRELEEDDFLRTMVGEHRLIYELEVERAYGMT